MKMLKRCLALALLSALLAGCGAAPAAAAEERSGEGFTVDLLSTGKSDCALIRMDELVLLSDAADSDDVPAILALLQERGVERIDALILSHFDKDHIGGAAGVLNAVPVGAIYSPDYTEDSAEYRALTQAAEAKAIPWNRLHEDAVLRSENGTVLLDPPDTDYGDDNNNSLLTLISWRGQKLLFLGDAQKKRMRELVSRAEADPALLSGTVAFVKLPHHGDSCKPLLSLLEQLLPRWAAETVSPFEYVEAELQETLGKTGTELFLTRDGAVGIAWDGTDLTITQTK